MKWSNFNPNAVFLVLLFIFSPSVHAQERYEKNMERYRQGWNKLIPAHSKIQFAGSMGFVSVGPGWDYGKKQLWETDILFGFLPRYSTSGAKMTLTVKQNLIPWNIETGKNFYLKPLSCGIYVNTIFNEDFWGKLPDKYPNRYYPFSTKLRINFSVGQGITYEIDGSKRYGISAVTLFYELHTNELYLVTALGNKDINITDVMKLSFGLKMEIF
jgi:hypothetical protein